MEEEAGVVGPAVAHLDRERSPQSGHVVSIRPSVWSAAQMPNASHAQFAYHQRSSAWTRYDVGTAENGFAIRRLAVGVEHDRVLLVQPPPPPSLVHRQSRALGDLGGAGARPSSTKSP